MSLTFILLVFVEVSADQTKSIQSDVVFLLDSSDEMQNDFQSILGFVETMVENLNVDENKDRVSVVQYSKEPYVDFFLNTHKTQQKVLENIRSLRHKGGRPLNTGAALQYVKDNVFAPSSGSRHQQGVPQILVLITGGRSNDSINNAIENLKRIGVIPFVVGTKKADIAEIQSVSQETRHAFLVSDSSELPGVEQQILFALRKGESTAMIPASDGKAVIKNLFHAQIHAVRVNI